MKYDIKRKEYYLVVDKGIAKLKNMFYTLNNDNPTRRTKVNKQHLQDSLPAIPKKLHVKGRKRHKRKLSMATKKPVERKATNKGNRSNDKPILRKQKKK